MIFLSKYSGSWQKKEAILWPQNTPAWEKQGQKLTKDLYFLFYTNLMHMKNMGKQPMQRAKCIKPYKLS